MLWGIDDKEKRFLISSVLEKYHLYKKTGKSTSTPFLNLVQVREIGMFLKGLDISYQIYAPNSVCERFILYFGEYEDFLTYYRISIPNVRHADVLGSLFGCGLSEFMIGDIFVLDDSVYLVSLSKYNLVLENNFTSIGTKFIHLQKVNALPYIEKYFQDILLLVSSLRFDLVLSRLIGASRRKTNDYMQTKRVFVNYQVVSRNYLVKVGDILSIEKVGKFVVRQIEEGKKGKIKILIQKYC